MQRIQKSNNHSHLQRVAGTSLLWKGRCKYAHKACTLSSLDGYDYCLKHILEDSSSPYRPCLYLYTNSGKKCGKAALRKDNLLCGEHSRKANVQKLRASLRPAPPETQETLLASLTHHVLKEQPLTAKKEDTKVKSSSTINPFVDVDAMQINSRASQVLDYLSGTDSDEEPATLDSVWRDRNYESSDAESVDSQGEDPLKYAGVYTAEEIATIMKEKMTRLQSLYIDQFRRLQHLLKERRRKYLHALKKEKETLCRIYDQDKTTPKEQKLYQKLKALNHYQKFYGEEAILHKKALERRAQATDTFSIRGSHKGKCAFTEGGVKCGAKTLPTNKFCRKHILEDTHQVLFRACGVKKGDNTCLEPTLSVFENATCVYHNVLPPQPHIPFVAVEPTKDVKMELEMSKAAQEEAAIVSTLLSLSGAELKPEDLLKSVGSEVPDTNSAEFLPSVPAKVITEASNILEQVVINCPNTSQAAVAVEGIKHEQDRSGVVPEHGYCVGSGGPNLVFVEDTASSSTETAATTDTEVAETPEIESLEANEVVKEDEQQCDEKMEVDVFEEEFKLKEEVKEVLSQEKHSGELEVVQLSEVGVVEEVCEGEVKQEKTEEKEELGAESERLSG